MERTLKITIKRFVNTAIIIMVVGCTSKTQKSEKKVSSDSMLSQNTSAMAMELKGLADNADPRNNYMLNEERAVYYYRNHLKTKGNDTLSRSFHSLYVEELINTGFLDKAISEIENHITAIEDKITIDSKKYFELLALAYLQKGEEENCVTHHSAKSCIIPIEGDGIHHNQEASKRAIAIYTKISDVFPNDLQNRWFLNLAYMTIGNYPNGVPKEYLIPNLDKKGNLTIPNFTDRAMHLGIDEIGLAGGVITEDFDDDGFLDIMASSYGLKDQLKLYKTQGKVILKISPMRPV